MSINPRVMFERENLFEARMRVVGVAVEGGRFSIRWPYDCLGDVYGWFWYHKFGFPRVPAQVITKRKIRSGYCCTRLYITTCNNEAYTLLPPSKHPFKKPFSGTKTIRTHPINIPVATELKIYYPFAGPKTPTTKCSNVSPFRIWIGLTDLAITRSASHLSRGFVASNARPALHAVLYPGSDIIWNVFRRCYVL